MKLICVEMVLRERTNRMEKMKATEMLEQEHRTIERVATASGVFAEMLQNGTNAPAGVLQSVVTFLRVYDDQYHHKREH